MQTKHFYVLLLGSNMGNSIHNLYEATTLLELYTGAITRVSSLYKTEPWGEHDQNEFINQAVVVASDLEPLKFLHVCQKIEKALGKNKITPYGPRTIDIDILFIDDMVLSMPELVVPHPKMQLRNFVLIPLSQIAPEIIHPVTGKSVREIKDECIDTGRADLLE